MATPNTQACKHTASLASATLFAARGIPLPACPCPTCAARKAMRTTYAENQQKKWAAKRAKKKLEAKRAKKLDATKAKREKAAGELVEVPLPRQLPKDLVRWLLG